jgi:AraC family transcriptional regulator
MSASTLSSAEAMGERIPGTLLAAGLGNPWKDLLAQIFTRRQTQEVLLIPAVPEPLIVWVLSGSAVVEEREIDGDWQANRVTAGDFFLTNTATPYELRWTAAKTAPFEVMHLYLGLPLLNRAATELYGKDFTITLRDVSGQRDRVLSALLEPLRTELTAPRPPSALFVQGIAQSLAVHVLRQYPDPSGQTARRQRSGLPAFKLRRVLALMEAHLDQEFHLDRLAREAGLSEFHFSRAFKRSTGFSPSRFLIRLRMDHARRLLRETDRSIVDVGLEVGYSSPSHFAQLFRREVGVTPREYRDQG